jgi:dTDP-4-dehydrorhamnose reductase
LFTTYNPSYAINCAVYACSDKAEDEIELARLIIKPVAACKAYLFALHATLNSFSTDFVFEENSNSF